MFKCIGDNNFDIILLQDTYTENKQQVKPENLTWEGDDFSVDHTENVLDFLSIQTQKYYSNFNE